MYHSRGPTVTAVVSPHRTCCLRYRGKVPTLHEHAEWVVDHLVAKGYISKFGSLPHF